MCPPALCRLLFLTTMMRARAHTHTHTQVARTHTTHTYTTHTRTHTTPLSHAHTPTHTPTHTREFQVRVNQDGSFHSFGQGTSGTVTLAMVLKLLALLVQEYKY
jgi:hypothetical protein